MKNIRTIGLLSAVLAILPGLVFPLGSQELDTQKQQSLEELQQIQSEISLTQQRKAELAAEIDALAKDRATLNRSLIETSAGSRVLEKRISRTGNRLSQLRSEQSDVRQSLNGRKALLSEILGALQRMGRKPPPALLVTPEDALSSVRSAILLGSVVPEVRSETDILITQLRDLVRISNAIESQRDVLSADLAKLAQEEERLNLLLAEKQKLSGSAKARLAQESVRSAELAAKATSLNALIADLEREIESAQSAAEAARLAEERFERIEKERIASGRAYKTNEVFSDLARTAPAIGFASAKGLLPTPVAGVQLAGFGDDDGTGDASDGVSLETRPNSRIISPTDAWVLYAGTFRSYGQLLILNAGSGYHVVLAGMERINVEPGQFVLVGEPVGSMGARKVASTGVVDVSTTKPILYVEFRKDGKSIDPAPWWSENNTKRATNGS